MENNQIVLVGYAVKDAELRYTKTGKAVCLFSIATNKRISEDKEISSFHNVVAWTYAEEVGTIQKGQPLIVVGSVQTRSYEKNGEKRYITEVIAERVGIQLVKQKDVGSHYDAFTKNDEEIPF